VRDHDLALVLAAEEEERVELRVVEGGQALEGRHWRRREKAHAGTGAVASTCWARLLTYSSSGCSSRSTSRERQNSRSRGRASGAAGGGRGGVLVRQVDHSCRPARVAVAEAAAIASGGEIGDDVELLSRLEQRLLEREVVARRDEELVRQAPLAQPRRERGEK